MIPPRVHGRPRTARPKSFCGVGRRFEPRGEFGPSAVTKGLGCSWPAASKSDRSSESAARCAWWYRSSMYERSSTRERDCQSSSRAVVDAGRAAAVEPLQECVWRRRWLLRNRPRWMGRRRSSSRCARPRGWGWLHANAARGHEAASLGRDSWGRTSPHALQAARPRSPHCARGAKAAPLSAAFARGGNPCVPGRLRGLEDRLAKVRSCSGLSRERLLREGTS